MTAMKKSIISVFIICPFVFSCDLLDTKYDMDITTDMVESDYTKVAQIGQSVYAYVKSGLWELDGNLAAARSDEAVQTTPGLTVSLYNNGSWDDLTNPENYLYDEFYKGIRNANYFLEYSVNYKELLQVNRDTISDGGTEYRRDNFTDELLESRERELIFECSRKWDLIRFNQIDQKISSLNKSGVDRSDIERVLGKEAADKIHDNYLIFPSDAYLKIGIPTLVDNWEAYKIWLPISEEQRGVNKSLTQNHGW